jgi:tetratricopeptide (TPR) repeat protein
MKKLKNGLLSLLTVSLILPLNSLGQVKEIPVTTSSKEALKYFLDGRDKFENIEFVAAASLFDKAITADPGFALAYLYRSQSGGGYTVFRQNIDKANNLAGKVSEGEKQEILYLKAQADGNGSKQKETLDWLLSNFPSDKRVQVLAGQYYYFINDFSASLEHFTKATEIDKNYAFAFNMIGYNQSSLNNYPDAEKAFQTYIRLDPDKGNPYDSYGELLLKMGKYDESIVQYKKAVEKDPLNFANSLSGIGNNYVFKGDYESARKYYQENYVKAPDVSGKLAAIFSKAISFVYEGNIDKSLSTFEEYRVLAEKENRPLNIINSYNTCGLILSETGKPAEGKKYFDKADELIEKSNLPEATKENLKTTSMMNHLYSLTAMKELDKAKAILDNCRQKVESRKNPTEEMMFNSVTGYYYLQNGNWDNAIGNLSKADKESPLNWYYTAVAYTKKGDKDNAQKLFDKVSSCNVPSLELAVVRNRAKEGMKN